MYLSCTWISAGLRKKNSCLALHSICMAFNLWGSDEPYQKKSYWSGHQIFDKLINYSSVSETTRANCYELTFPCSSSIQHHVNSVLIERKVLSVWGKGRRRKIILCMPQKSDAAMLNKSQHFWNWLLLFWAYPHSPFCDEKCTCTLYFHSWASALGARTTFLFIYLYFNTKKSL